MSIVHGASGLRRAYMLVWSTSHRCTVVHVISGSALSVNMRKSVKKCASCVAPARLRDASRAADVACASRRQSPRAALQQPCAHVRQAS